MPQPNDLSRSPIALNQDGTVIAVVEMSRSSWLVAGIVPGIARHPLKKLAPDEAALLGLLERWRDEATQAGRRITRIAVAFEAGRDGFWLARWLRAHGIEAYVIHPTSVAVSREHRRAKTDRRDTALLKRVFLGWLRGEPDHCTMAAVRTLEDEDARQEDARQEDARQEGLATQPDQGPDAMVRLLARVIGIGIETADMLVHEILSRNLRDRRAVARYAGLTGSPDESGAKRREKGLAKVGNARVRRGMVQLAWRFLLFQKDSALAQWYRARTADARGGTRKTMIVALARKLLIALWRFVSTGEAPEGVVLRPAS